MFKTHYMWPSGIYSGAFPVTPFHIGVPWGHGEMSSCKALKNDEEKRVGERVMEELWGEDEIWSEIFWKWTLMGVLFSSSCKLQHGEDRTVCRSEGAQVEKKWKRKKSTTLHHRASSFTQNRSSIKCKCTNFFLSCSVLALKNFHNMFPGNCIIMTCLPMGGKKLGSLSIQRC